MPILKKISDTMKKQKISDEIMAQIDFEADCNDPGEKLDTNGEKPCKFTFEVIN